MIDEKDAEILRLLQKDCKISARKIADELRSPITTVYSRIKRMEESGIIKGYKAVLDAGKAGLGTLAFILVSFFYRREDRGASSQREVAKKIAMLPEVQETHIITGDWDILLKVRVKNVEELGRLVIDTLRTIKGVERTLTCVTLSTIKETTEIKIPQAKQPKT